MSHTTKKVSDTAHKVQELLCQSSQYRNSDNALVVRVWWDEIQDKNMSAKDFFMLYKEGIITNADTISRARRKLQERLPSLRGDTWHKRHKEADDTKYDMFTV